MDAPTPCDEKPGGSPGHSLVPRSHRRLCRHYARIQALLAVVGDSALGTQGKNQGVLWEQHQRDVCLSLCLPEPFLPSHRSSVTG